MLKLYCLITGDPYKTIREETNDSIKKIRMLALSIFFPVVFWMINSYLLASNVLMLGTTHSLMVMLVCGSIIFMLEKLIIMSNGGRVMMLFRLFIGLITATLGSIALDEVIFKNDIDTQLTENKNAFIEKNITAKREKLITELNEQKKKIDEKNIQWQTSYNKAIEELDGTGGSGQPGFGNRTSLKLRKAEELKSEYDISKYELSDKQNSVDSTLKAEELVLSGNYNENSILIRVKAMFDLIKNEPSMIIIYLMFFLLITALEFSPLMLKMFSKETNYERKNKVIEEIGKKRLDALLKSNPLSMDNLVIKEYNSERKKNITKPLTSIFN